MHHGVLRLGDIALEVAVLDNGQRVITQDGFVVGLGLNRPPKGKGRQYYRSGANLPAFLTVPNLKPFVGEHLLMTLNRIEFRTKQGVKAFGYTLNFLLGIYDVFARAERCGVLKATQRSIASRAAVIAEQLQSSDAMRLIDEAVCYPETR